MVTSWGQLLATGFVLALVQILAAVPWVMVLTSEGYAFGQLGRRLGRIVVRLIIWSVVAGLVIAGALFFERDRELMTTIGRFYGAVLYVQLVLDFFVAVFAILLVAWPRGAAVAMAAFREGIRQPMFWFIITIAVIILFVMPFVPYFTFGEDLKMVKELGYDIIMLSAVLFGVLAASISISEEIEGRTAITVMSKPISRRQFLLGKFFGILMASLLMTGILSVCFFMVLWYKPVYDREPVPAPVSVLFQIGYVEAYLGPTPTNFIVGVAWWFADAVIASPGLILGFCQVMVLVAVAVALATRLPMVVNLVIGLVIFFLGHLTPVLAQVSQQRYALVKFVAQLFDTLLPGLDLFNLGTALTRDTLPDAGEFAWYVGSVSAYALLYTIIALLFGLILFEDRDLA